MATWDGSATALAEAINGVSSAGQRARSRYLNRVASSARLPPPILTGVWQLQIE